MVHPGRPDPGIVIVAVDDRTLGAINRVPPIPRGYYARAPDRLRAAGARLIVVDVQFIGAGPSRADDDALVADFGDPACPGNVNEACTVSEYVTVYDE